MSTHLSGLLMVLAAICCNATAQIALKYGGEADLQRWQNWFNLPLLLGAGLYGVSFILTVKVYAAYPLSIISPVMAGAIFVLITLGSAWCFAEPITLHKLMGISLVVAGVALLGKDA